MKKFLNKYRFAIIAFAMMFLGEFINPGLFRTPLAKLEFGDWVGGMVFALLITFLLIMNFFLISSFSIVKTSEEEPEKEKEKHKE